MLFNSYLFMLFFLPLCLAGWFLTPARTAPLFLLAMSLWFYAANDPYGLPVLIASALINWYIGRRLTKTPSKSWLVLGLVLNLGTLGVLKYLNFVLHNLNRFIGTDFGAVSLLLPLGISFFTFQQVAYLIDAYHGKAEPYALPEYALFVSFFPYVMSGPIAFHSEIIPQLRDPRTHTLNWENFARGLTLISYGLAKKVLLADILGQAVNVAWNDVQHLSTATALVAMFSYTFQLYFDFSGYCDIAAGTAKMIGIDLPRNFNSPYRACSITEFWKRWHMTMTRFFTQYLYIPLGGSRKGFARTCLNTMVVFLFSGLWHGANWTFIVWGGLHGLALTLAKIRDHFTDKRLPKPLGWILTFLFVNLAWVFFRAPSLTSAHIFFQKLFSNTWWGLPYSMYSCFMVTEAKAVNQLMHLQSETLGLVATIFFLVLALVLSLLPHNAITRTLGERFRPSALQLSISTVLLVWSILSFTGISTFLYFNF